MKKYFYSDGVKYLGPFTKDELKERNISRETKVWYHELEDWEPAGNIPELTELFTLAPPPIKNIESNSVNMSSSNLQSPPKTWLVESILVTIFCCFPLGIAGIVNASKVESLYNAGDIEGANRASTNAKTWTLSSFWIAIVAVVFYFISIFANAI